MIFTKILRYKEIDSTNEEAKRLIKEKKAEEGTVIVADFQTNGKGKPGSSWFSPPGTGIYLSAIVKPFVNLDELPLITLIGAKAALSSIEKISGLKGAIKLPNDVMLGGKKIGGVLVERISSGHVIIGIGLNVNQALKDFPDELQKSATSLKMETGNNFSINETGNNLVSELNRQYIEFLSEKK